MRHIPVEVYLGWPAPNYVNPERRGPGVYVINAVFLFLVTIAIFARLYVRIFIRRWFGSDDVFIVVSYFPAIALAVCVCTGYSKYGWDKHIWDLPMTIITPSAKLLYITKVIMPVAATSVRISLCCFYYRLLAHAGMRQFRWIIHCTLVFVITLALTMMLLNIFMCSPIESYWIFPQLPDSHCLPEAKVLMASSSINTFAEFVVTTLPIPMAFYLPMEKRQRLSVIVLLCMGFTVCIVGCARTYFVWLGMMGSYDQTWWSYPHWICAAIEVDLAIICACAPALRPLIVKVFPHNESSAKKVRLARGPGSQTKLHKSQFIRDNRRLPAGTTSRYNILWSPKATTEYPGTIVYQTIDFDELDHGEFGNTVEISAKRKSRKLDITPSTILRRPSSREKSQKKRSRKDSDDKNQQPQKLHIMTQHSFDMRESIHEVRESAEMRQRELFWAENAGNGPDGDSVKFQDWGLLSSRNQSRRGSGEEENQMGHVEVGRRSETSSTGGRGSTGGNSRKGSTEAPLIESVALDTHASEGKAVKSTFKASVEEVTAAIEQGTGKITDKNDPGGKVRDAKEPSLASPTPSLTPPSAALLPISCQIRRSISGGESRHSEQRRRSRDTSYQLLS